MPTGIIHDLDSIAEDHTVGKVIEYFGWALSIHDATLACPEACTFGRKVYANQLEQIHTNRKSILTNYFRSIGIKASAIPEWKEVMELVSPLTEEFHCNPLVLK